MASGVSITQMAVGDHHQRTVLMTEEMMIAFTQAIGDYKSFHQDPDMARDSYFGKIVAPGMLTASLIGFVLGTEYPGLGTIYVSQELKFLKPVFSGDELSIKVTVLELNPDKNRAKVETLVKNQEGQVVLQGVAEIIPPLDKAA